MLERRCRAGVARRARQEVVEMRRIAVAIVLVLAAGCWPAAHALAAAPVAAQAAPAQTVQADFNNDGADDLAVGVPGENVGGIVDAGSVNVLYGSTGTGLSGAGSQLFTQPVSAGAVSAVAGSAGGLVGDGLLFTQATPGVPSVAEPEDFFAFALAADDPGPATTAALPSSAAASKIQRVTGAGR